MNYPLSIRNLIECFKKLPGIGEKTAERLALATLNLDQEIIDLFSNSIINVKSKIKRCQKCNNLSEEDICEICKQEQRDKKTICVVEDPKNVVIIEKVGTYKGMYYVLDGLISPLDGVNPEDIRLNELLERIQIEQIKEVIIAVKPSVEGETTALYISKILKDLPVKVTRIAHGVPIGFDLEYIDLLSLELALENRQNIS